VAVQYPGAVKTFSTKVDFADTILAEHVNSLQDEVNALEANLGTYIRTGSGWVGSFDQITTSWPTLKDRIANIEYGITKALSQSAPAGGSQNQVLTKNSASDYDYSWATVNALPSFQDNAGKYLTNDGSTAKWEAVESSISPILLIGA
jgi:hypothetical protein